MKLTHRAVCENDIPIICGFPQTVDELFFMFPKASFPLTSLQLKESIYGRSDSTVVEVDGVIAGFANFYKWETGEGCHIGNVIVSPIYRGCGLGRYLIETMINLGVSRHKAKKIYISCFNMNVSGLLLYTSIGFKPSGIEERKDKKGNRAALINMVLDT